jgi:hypothetical protein
VVHGLHLLELVWGEDGGELVLRVLLDGTHLFVFGFGVSLGVGHEGGDFFLAAGEDRLDFGGLVGCEVQLFAEECGGFLRVGSVLAASAMMSFDRRGGLLSGLWGRLRLLGKREASGKGENEGCGKQDAFHVCCSLWQRGGGTRCKLLE